MLNLIYPGEGKKSYTGISLKTAKYVFGTMGDPPHSRASCQKLRLGASTFGQFHRASTASGHSGHKHLSLNHLE